MEKKQKIIIPNPHRPNMWGFLSNFFIASLGKGQLILAMAGIGLLVLLCKIPGTDVIPFIKMCFNAFKDIYIIGWILFIFVLVFMFFYTRHIRKIHDSEMNRISSEKKELQEKLLKRSLPSSNN